MDVDGMASPRTWSIETACFFGAKVGRDCKWKKEKGKPELSPLSVESKMTRSQNQFSTSFFAHKFTKPSTVSFLSCQVLWGVNQNYPIGFFLPFTNHLKGFEYSNVFEAALWAPQ